MIPESPLDRKEMKPILREINPQYSLEGLILKLTNTKAEAAVSWSLMPTHWKRTWCWERLRTEEKRASEGEMSGWHHRCNGHELGQTSGDGEGQGSLACCNPWGRKESDTTGQLTNNNNSWLTMLWEFQVGSEETQPYILNPFSPKLPSHLGYKMTLSRIPCWLSILNSAVYMTIPKSLTIPSPILSTHSNPETTSLFSKSASLYFVSKFTSIISF